MRVGNEIAHAQIGLVASVQVIVPLARLDHVVARSWKGTQIRRQQLQRKLARSVAGAQAISEDKVVVQDRACGIPQPVPFEIRIALVRIVNRIAAHQDIVAAPTDQDVGLRRVTEHDIVAVGPQDDLEAIQRIARWRVDDRVHRPRCRRDRRDGTRKPPISAVHRHVRTYHRVQVRAGSQGQRRLGSR